jgi:hypothetical protein
LNGLLALQNTEPVTANRNMLAQATRAREVNPRNHLADYQAAQMAGMIPGAGLLGVLGDVQQYMDNPETRGSLNYGLTALGAVPFLGALAKMSGPLRGVPRSQAGAIAYHGSPHSFDQFDMSKIGTGEGAQAYGHGLYFAENPGVAQQYQRNLSQKDLVQYAGPDRVRGAAGMLASGVPEKQVVDAMRTLDQTFDSAKLGEAKSLLRQHSGNLYKVDIPDEQIGKMLDWDKPLSQQSGILKSLETDKIFGKDTSGWRGAPAGLWEKNMSRRTGEDIYRDLTQRGMSQAQATEYLRSLGIPGIQYLDQGSRSAGQGTRNFVVFDDKLPKIVGRE